MPSESALCTPFLQTMWHWHRDSFPGEPSILRMHIFVQRAFVKLPEQANGMSSIDGVTMTMRTTEAAQWTKTWCLPADDNLYWSEAPNILEIHSKGKSQPLHLFFLSFHFYASYLWAPTIHCCRDRMNNVGYGDWKDGRFWSSVMKNLFYLLKLGRENEKEKKKYTGW